MKSERGEYMKKLILCVAAVAAIADKALGVTTGEGND